MDFTTILFYLVTYFSIWLCVYVLASNLRSNRFKKTPPGPYRFPVIGNLHQIGQNPHQTLAKLSKKHGPLMSLRLGFKEVVVASSAKTAREVLQKNDQICSSRAIPHAAHAHDHHKISIGWLPVAGPWRHIRKLCREQMFAPHRLDASQELRLEKVKELVEYVGKCSESRKSMNIGEAVFVTSLNLISRTICSVDFASFDSNLSQELKEVVCGLMKYVGAPNVADFFPFLRFVDPQGILRNAKGYYGKVLDIFGDIIQERLLVRGESKKSDLLEALLDESSKNESLFNINVLKHLLLDLFVAGTDTTSNTVEWAMAELMHNPEKLEKVRVELNQVIGDKSLILQESDIPRLPYLQAVVKETFRLHPVAPLLIPHKASEDVEIGGYLVPKDTEILVNVWASGRDEATWTQPEMFMPERFLGSEIDAKGNHYELIPFGAGRRICPGLPLAHRMVHLMLASLIHNIGWELEGGVKPEDLDMEEKFDFTIHKAIPLRAIQPNCNIIVQAFIVL